MFHNIIFCYWYYLHTKRKTWTIYFVYVFLASANAILLKRVKAHAIQRELSTSVLAVFFNFADFGIQESKSGYSSYMSFFISVLAHRQISFIGSTILNSLAKIAIYPLYSKNVSFFFISRIIIPPETYCLWQ